MTFYNNLRYLEQCCFLYEPGGGAFAFCFVLTLGHFTNMFFSTLGNLPFFQKMLMPGVWPGRLGGGVDRHC